MIRLIIVETSSFSGDELTQSESPKGGSVGGAPAEPVFKPARQEDEEPEWKRQAEGSQPIRGRGAALVIIALIVVAALLIAGAVAWALRPRPREVWAELSVGAQDVSILPSRPSGDNKSAIVPVEVEITNRGEGRSGVINVWCGAYNRSNPSLRVDEFNTSQLFDINGGVSDRIQPAGKPGSIVRARGNLSLPPGSYEIRLRIYEDAGKRTLVFGRANIVVGEDMVATPQPYVPEGGERGRGYMEGGGAIPGMGAGAALAAVALSLFLFGTGRRKV